MVRQRVAVAFTMPEQSYADNIWRYMGGTPAVAALYQSRAGQTLVGEIGARKIRDKSLVMTQACIDWVDELGMTLNSPRASQIRGGSIVFDFVGSADVCRELNRRRFFCDHRPGVGIRIAPHSIRSPKRSSCSSASSKDRSGAGRYFLCAISGAATCPCYVRIATSPRVIFSVVLAVAVESACFGASTARSGNNPRLSTSLRRRLTSSSCSSHRARRCSTSHRHHRQRRFMHRCSSRARRGRCRARSGARLGFAQSRATRSAATSIP